jgi:asparaginyl-tRNA synthetase
MSYDDAVALLLKRLRDAGHRPGAEGAADFQWGKDFGAPHETAIASSSIKPVFVIIIPQQCQGVLHGALSLGRPEVCKSVDLLAPEGYGEIIGGSERIADPDLLDQRIREHNLPLRAYEWYIDLRKYGSVPHAGFGLGVERTVAWICGVEHIRETIPFPRMLYRLYP